jgi:hypothetical protein
MVGNITAANTNIVSLQSNITATNSAIITANTGMRTYVDTAVATAVIQASGYGNAVVAVYLPVNPTINSIQANVIAANANISVLTTNAASQSSEISGLRANITAANANITSYIVSTNSNITAANLNITSLQSNITAANLNITSLQSNITAANTKIQFLTANVGGSVFTNNVYLGEGNLVVGNINASGNLVMRGTDATTIRFVRSPDTSVTSGEIYGSIDFAGEDSSTAAAGTRARIAVTAAPSASETGETEIKFYTGGTNGIAGQPIQQTFMTNSSGYYGSLAGFEVQQVPEFQTYASDRPNFAPVTNDGSIGLPYLYNVTSGAVTKYYGGGGMAEHDIGGTFSFSYAGFPGRDTANILLSGYLSSIGSGYPVVYYDSGQTDLEISVNGIHVVDSTAITKTYKRLRKHWVATVVCSDTFIYTVLDQQLQNFGLIYSSPAIGILYL